MKYQIRHILNQSYLPVNGGIIEIKTDKYFDDLPTFAKYFKNKYFKRNLIFWEDIAYTIYCYINSFYETKAILKAKQLNLH